MVKNLPANTGNLGLIPRSGRFFGEGNNNPLQWGIPGEFLGQKDSLEKEITTHSSGGRIPGEFLGMPGEFHGQRSLVGYSPWGHKESDTTE